MRQSPMLTQRTRPRLVLPAVAAMLALVLACLAGAGHAGPPVPAPLAYWAFNCFTTCGDANFQPEFNSTATASMSSSFEPDAGVNEIGTRLNAVGFHEARSALTLRTGSGGINNGRNVSWRVNLVGASHPGVSFATRRSTAGFASVQFQVSGDGATFVNVDAPFDPGPDFRVVSFDLKHVRELKDNSNASFRLVFDGGSTASATEYALIDNLQVSGK